MIQSDHNNVINKRFVNPELLIPIILIFIPLLVSGSDSLLTFSIHKRGGGGGRWLQKKNVEKLLRKPEMGETMLQRKRTKKRKEKEQLRDFGL